MHFDTLARHSALSSEEYTAMLSRLIKKLENRFQDYKKNQFTFPTLFAYFLVAYLCVYICVCMQEHMNLKFINYFET